MPRILIADDDPLLCDLIAFVLEGQGHVARFAQDGQATLDAVANDTPDLVILDCMMPVLSGLEVLRALANSGDVANPPVIMLSARKRQMDVAEAMRAGAAAYLTKPFQPDELLASVETALKPALSRRALAH